MGWGMRLGERHIQMEWLGSGQDDATSLPADVGDKTRSQVTRTLFMIHNV